MGGVLYDRFADPAGLVAETERVIDQLVAFLGLRWFTDVQHFPVGPLHGGGQPIMGRQTASNGRPVVKYAGLPQFRLD